MFESIAYHKHKNFIRQEELMEFLGHCSSPATIFFFLLLSTLPVFQNIPLTIIPFSTFDLEKVQKIIILIFFMRCATAMSVLCFPFLFTLVSSIALDCSPTA